MIESIRIERTEGTGSVKVARYGKLVALEQSKGDLMIRAERIVMTEDQFEAVVAAIEVLMNQEKEGVQDDK